MSVFNNLCGTFFVAMMLVWVIIFALIKVMNKNPEEGSVIKDAGKKLAVKGVTAVVTTIFKRLK
jgi:hypothetical protein